MKREESVRKCFEQRKVPVRLQTLPRKLTKLILSYKGPFKKSDIAISNLPNDCLPNPHEFGKKKKIENVKYFKEHLKLSERQHNKENYLNQLRVNTVDIYT